MPSWDVILNETKNPGNTKRVCNRDSSSRRSSK